MIFFKHHQFFSIPHLSQQKALIVGEQVKTLILIMLMHSTSHAYLLYVSECSLASKGGTP